MKDIYVVSMDGIGQYDEYGNQVVEWNEKQGNWVVLPKYVNCNLIYHEDENGITDIPRACYPSMLSDTLKLPDISLKIQYDYQGKTYYDSRYWGYLDYTKEKAIKQLGEFYAESVCINFQNVKLQLYYNNELIWVNL